MTLSTRKDAINLYDLTREEMAELLAGWGYSSYHAEGVWTALYQDGVNEIGTMTNVRSDLRRLLAERARLGRLDVETAVDSADNLTRKYLLRLPDGELIETVRMLFKGRDGTPRATACISTQVGCAMGCVFCATGQMGFSRHLTPGEIVAQALHVDHTLRAEEKGVGLRNIVLMGMGEPLHNYDNTLTAVSILTDHKGLSLAPKHITLSTVGVVPGIRRLADEGRAVNLAVSLHGADDAARQALVPPARRWPLAELMAACRYYTEKRNRRIFFEWTLIAGENDTPGQAHALGQLLQGMDAHVNLIPLNPTGGYDGRPSRSPAATRFQAILADYGLPSTVRQRRGVDIAAGCGQLRVQP